MSWLLLGNDDGCDSPALVPFANALETVFDMPVRIAVPSTERSWSGKAITRVGGLRSERVARGGREVVAVDGSPADAIQLGMYGLFGHEFVGSAPSAVVTGINLGYNHGTAFMSSSGTVWAAIEASFAGLPAIAVSTGHHVDHANWVKEAWHDDSAESWVRLSEAAAATVAAISSSDLVDHCDVVSVNLPWGATTETPRRVTRLTPLTYGPLFEPDQDRPDTATEEFWQFAEQLSITVGESAPDGDIRSIRDETIAITPINVPSTPDIPDATRTALEGP